MAELLDEAISEIQEAAAWYEEEAPGVGARFVIAAERSVGRLDVAPGVGQSVEFAPARFEVRRVSVYKFPFVIFYATRPRLVVVAVAHMRRRPGYWLSRLESVSST